MQVIKTVKFPLKDGTEVTIDMSEKLLQEIARSFQIDAMLVDENHIKYYLTSSMKNVIKSEEGN